MLFRSVSEGVPDGRGVEGFDVYWRDGFKAGLGAAFLLGTGVFDGVVLGALFGVFFGASVCVPWVWER